MSDNTASNLGTGQGVFAQKVGDDLQFKSLLAGTNVTLTADANNITITASNDTTALNLGIGSGLFTSKSGDNLQLKSIIANAASGISVTPNSNDLTFQLVSANVDAGKLGGVAASDFLRKSDNLASLASAATARTNLDVYSKAEIDANVIRNNQNNLPDTDSTYSLGSNSYKWLNIYADNFYGRASVAGAIDSIANIGDVDTSGAVNGSVLKYNSSTTNWEVGTDLSGGGGGGSATFVGLTDTPANFTGDAGKFVRVNSGENALEFTTDVATQTYVNTQVANLVDSAPGTLDTLNELAAALGDDANFATTVTNSIATKLATADFNTTFDNRLATKSTTNLTEGTNLYYTNARVDAHLNQSNPTSGYVLSWNGSDYAWVANGGSGDISRVNITAGTGLTGTKDTTTGDHTQTLNVDVGTTANKIVQLDGSGRLPAVDGSQLTGVSTTTTLAGLTDTTIGTAANGEVLFYNGSAWVDQALTTDNVSEGANLYYTNARADARIGAANISDLANVHTAAPTDGQVLKWDNGNGRWAPANDTDTVYTSFNSDFDTRLASKDTGDVAEGSNLYFTNARADARISAASLTALSNVDAVAAGDDGKVLYYDHSSTSFKWKVDATGGSSYGNSDVDAHLNQSNPTAGYVLSWNGSDYAWVNNAGYTNTDFDNRLATKTTDNLTEGSTNLYHTNARSIAAVQGTNLNMGSNNITTTGKILYSNVYANLVDLPSAATYHGMFAHVHATGKGYFAHGGAWIELANHSQLANSGNWDTAFGWGDHGAAGYLTSVPAQSFASLTGKPTTIAGYGITDAFDNADFDTRLASKTTANLTEGANLYFTNARADARIGAANISDLANVHTAAPTDGQVLKWDNGNSRWAPANDTDTVYTTFNTDFDNRLATKSTTNLAEGTNLYYTDARARAAISEGSAQLSYNSGTGVLTFTQGDTDTVAEGSTNLYFTNARADARADARIAAADTDALSEGSTNLYYTNARADARIANNILDEDNFASNSATNTASQQSIKAYVDAQVASENELSEMNDVTITSVANNHFIKYNASTSKWENASVAPATAAGNNTEVQFNDGGVMGSDPGMVYNKTTNDLTVSGKILYSNVYSAEGDLPSAATYHGMFAHVHATGKGYFAHGGAWRKLLDESSSSTTNLTEGTNLYYTDARARAAISEGSAQLSYNSSTGVLTFTQDDTDGIAEGSTNLYFTNARADARITAALIDEDNMASNSATRLPSQQSVKAYVDAQVASKDNTDEITEGSTNLYYTDARAQAVSINNVVEDTTPQLGGTLDANGNTIDMGTNVITDAKVGQWDTAYGWGDHGAAGYQTSAGLNAAIDSHLNQSNPTSGYVLSWNGSDYAWVTNAGYTNTDFDNRLATKTTDNLTEGSSNLYYTDARADTRATLRIGAANLSALNDVNNATPTDGQVLTWDNSNSYWKPAAASGGGTFGLAANTGSHTFNTATETLTFLGTTGQINAGIAANNVTLSLDPNINSITSISFEGSTADNNETKLQAVDPTADRTINLPDASGHLAVFATASPAAITDGTNGQALVTDGNGQLSFTTISGGSSLTVQDEGSSLSTAATTLNFVGAGVTASGTGATKTITIAGGGGGSTAVEMFKINYATNGNLSSISDKSSGISSVSIDSATGGDITINFTGYSYPPASITLYGYNYAANKYNVTPLNKDITLREIPGGGSSGSPTAFGSFSSIKIKAAEGDAGASRSFGTATHTWVQVVMGG